MLVKTFGSALYGVDAITIAVEVNVMKGRKYFIVGLPDNAVKESIQRVESALKTNGYRMPRTKLVVNWGRKRTAAGGESVAIGCDQTGIPRPAAGQQGEPGARIDGIAARNERRRT